MSLDAPIAHGRSAEIHPWKDGQILKLFHDWLPTEAVQHEARIARAVHAAGLAAPRAGEIVEVGGRLGLEYERLDGMPMGKEMAARPWSLARLSRLLAKLHVEMHAVEGMDGLPPQRARLETKIRRAGGLDPGLQAAVLRALDRMPEGDRLCHNDFHPWNVMMTGRGAVVIDWTDAACGNPLADVARTALVLGGVRHMTEMVTWKEKLAAGLCCRAYLRRTFELRPGSEFEYRAWWPIVAAARMDEEISGLEEWLRAQVEKGVR